MIFSSQKPKAFGLDISDFSLKLAQLEKDGDYLKLVSFGEEKVPRGIIEGGKVKDEKGLTEVIRKLMANVKGKKLKSKYVICSLPEEKSFLDVLQIPLLKEEELDTAVRFEAENYIPMPLDEVYFDFEKIEPVVKHPKYQEVLIAAMPKETIDAYLRALKGAGLKPLVVEVESLTIVRALIKKDTQQTAPLLVIDFGESRTSFLIFAGKSLRFTSTIPVSSQGLTEAITRNLKVSLEKAELLKRKNGLEGEEEVFNAMVPALTDLGEQIKTHLAYYHSHAPEGRTLRNGKRITKILLCGGGANLKGLPNFLSSILKTTVVRGNPWVNILKAPLKEIPELPFEKSLGFTTALGLALRDTYGH